MNFSAIDIQGNIVSSDIITQIKNDDIRFQKVTDFGLETGTSLRDEIGIAWSAAQAHWKAFSLRRDRLKEFDTGTSETRQGWMVPFLRELGYDIDSAKSYLINEKNYAISHKAANRDNFPIHIVGINQSLDKRAEHGTRLSPHALVQEFLNNHEHLYAIVTNGKYLRLLRDATRLSRLSYLEFNLEQMMEEELYAEFAVLFRVLHASRMPEKEDAGETAIIEFYHQEALASGTRIRGELSKAVEQSIKLLANGLLKNHNNKDLRARAINGDLAPDQYYLYMLRTVYRMLFLLVIEERNLIYAAERDADLNKKRDVYYKYYSIQRLTKLVESAIYVDPNKTDLWQSLKTNFLLFEKSFYGEKLGIAPLGSGLFAPTALAEISDQHLDNESLLKVLRNLVMFENENHQLTRVNYADLDVEEFGSVYEGLLEYDPEITYGEESHQLIFSFKKGEGRSSSGSHYTPEELVKPLIKHSLDYIIEDKLKVEAGIDRKTKLIKLANNLLSITVCDVACGSGHILLSAARRIGFELAKIRESLDQNADVEQPSPPYLRQAIRSVIKHCIYGVDLNPLAVELCKVAFWLEAHNPGEPLNFLDHHIKNGNAIVGLAHLDELTEGIATEAFKTLPSDDKNIASDLRKKNAAERKAREKNKQQGAIAKRLAEGNIQKVTDQLNDWAKLSEDTPTQIDAKAKAYDNITNSAQWHRLEQLADTQVAQFFLAKTNSNDFVTDGQYYQYLINNTAIQNTAISLATGMSATEKFFHWFLEFPEVLTKGGFDCILGNPPYLGDKKLKSNYGDRFIEFQKHTFYPIGAVDLSGYFLRRIDTLLHSNAYLSILTTNSIAQGNTRKGGLEILVKRGRTINHAIESMKWPGAAAVEVSLVTLTKRLSHSTKILNGKNVTRITPRLKDSEEDKEPFVLKTNQGKSFIGSYVLGSGFVLEKNEALHLIKTDSNNKDVIFPFLNGYDLNNDPNYEPSRYVINFFDWPERRLSTTEWKDLSSTEKKGINKRIKEGKFIPLAPPYYQKRVAQDYPDCFNIIEEKVKPERQRWKIDSDGKEIIGEFAVRSPMPERWWIYGEKRPGLYQKISNQSKTICIALTSKTVAFVFKDTDMVFSHATVVIGSESYVDFSVLQSSIHRSWVDQFSSRMKTDQRYTPSSSFENFPFPIDDSVQDVLFEIGKAFYLQRDLILKDFQIGLTTLYNKINNHKDDDIEDYRVLIKNLDKEVLIAYGWHEASQKWGKPIDLRHDFYELEYLPENDRVRYTIHPEARKEVLKRLLLLNHESFEEEAKKGLHKKKDVEAFYEQKGVEIPEEILAFYNKTKKKKTSTPATKVDPNLLLLPFQDTMRPFELDEGIYTIRDVAEIIGRSKDTVRRWFLKLAEANYEGLSDPIQRDIDQRRISFHGLVELVVIGTLLENKMSIRKIFEARNDLGQKTSKTYPFATNNVTDKLHKAGNVLVYDFLVGHVTLDGSSQLNLTLITDFFEEIEFNSSGIALRLFPKKGQRKIVIDPAIAGGKPSFTNHRGIRIETIKRFYNGPDSVDELIENYNISREEIDLAIAYSS